MSDDLSLAEEAARRELQAHERAAAGRAWQAAKVEVLERVRRSAEAFAQRARERPFPLQAARRTTYAVQRRGMLGRKTEIKTGYEDVQMWLLVDKHGHSVYDTGTGVRPDGSLLVAWVPLDEWAAKHQDFEHRWADELISAIGPIPRPGAD